MAELLELANSKADYEDVADEIYRLRDQKQKLQVENANRDELKKRMADMSAFLQEQPTTINEYARLRELFMQYVEWSIWMFFLVKNGSIGLGLMSNQV